MRQGTQKRNDARAHRADTPYANPRSALPHWAVRSTFQLAENIPAASALFAEYQFREGVLDAIGRTVKPLIKQIISILSLAASAIALTAPLAHADDPFLRRTATVRAVEKVGPAVVNITTEVVVQQSPFRSPFGDPSMDEFFRDFFEPRRPRTQTAQSAGSGVLIDAERRVLTNEHVIHNANRIFVTLSDGREYEAELIGADPNNDIAVLQLKTNDTIPWIPMGTAKDLLVGEPVIAIGNPFGLSNTVTTGVLSASGRSLRTNTGTFHGFLQTDASINPGNSGGPLLNAEGTLIGINTAIYNGAEGIGFAIPIDVARRIVGELITHGEIAPVWLGFSAQDLTPELRRALQVSNKLTGAVVNRVDSVGPAAKGGLQRGDVITKFDGQAIETASDIDALMRRSTRGQEIALEVWSGQNKRQLVLRAEELKPEAIDALAWSILGVELAPGIRGEYFEVTNVRAASPAQKIGMQKRDRLLAVNGRRLKSQALLRNVLVDLRGANYVRLVVQRENGQYHVTVPLQ